MKHLIIIGAGGYGRETFALAMGSAGYGETFDIKGFLDAKPDALDGFTGYPPVIGAPETYAPQPDDVFITALGGIPNRRKCAKLIEDRGGHFISLIHKTATLGPNVTIDGGTLVAPNAFLSADVRVGRHAAVFHGTSIGHDAVLGDFSHVYAQCSVGGAVRIEEGAIVYPGAVIVPRRTIGADAVVGAGATVILNVKPGTSVTGNPAKEIT